MTMTMRMIPPNPKPYKSHYSSFHFVFHYPLITPNGLVFHRDGHRDAAAADDDDDDDDGFRDYMGSYRVL